ncbi:hypothetical protein F6R98_15040 [Candidatus Methylospira mobilis]|uniref:Porin n=1 Tax=Candidatus Methylospira mobilis TaxID=1808979 RepID=A0A5Q0BNW0_9GAMM|nr:DcaP family trimeric outer membrane transporter [Candidatus Methylospira mobilis]QFY43777.1 hypothetical protein F6R98_15040 [Candidatus Methylospira mobilis]WNV04767.1 DcaP family trimeric outer membrane transporter [Candidatus Methylospira mobilis]
MEMKVAVTVMPALLWIIGAGPACADTQDGEIRQLKAMMQLMQKSMKSLQTTIEQQNARIAELEKIPQEESQGVDDSAGNTANNRPASVPENVAVAAAPVKPFEEKTITQAAAPQSSLLDPEAVAKAAQEEKRKNPGDLFKTEPEPGRLGETVRIPSGIALEFYGFVETDGIYDANPMNPAWSATLRPSMIPVDCAVSGQAGCGTHAATMVSVKQSRFGFKTLMPTPTLFGDVKTMFEFDLFGVGANAGQTTFRLRHIWAEVAQFGIGQTWSNFMDVDVWPNIVDYWGPPGMIFQRQPQFRWTPVNENGKLVAVAIESPNSAIDSGKIPDIYSSATFTATPRNPLPDLTTRLRLDPSWGHAQLASVFRSVGYQNTAVPSGEPAQNFFGWGINASSSIRTFGKDQLLTQLAYGKGIASYIEDGGADIAPNANLSGGKVLPLLGVVAYYDHYWSDQWSSSIGYSETLQQNSAGQLATAFHSGQYASTNLLWAPFPKLLTGVELLWGRRVDYNGMSADDKRIQFTVRYNYDISFHPQF